MYELAVVSFIDLLGFKDLIMMEKPCTQRVNEVLDLFAEFSGAGKDRVYEDSPWVFNFSDSIIRVRTLTGFDGDRHRIGALIFELSDLLRAQALLIDSAILVRGGVAFGEIAVTESRVFGPALIEAYEIESKFARCPRIVVSQKALKDLEDTDKPLSECTDRSYEKELVARTLRQAEDGFWFVDYLAAIARELEPPEAYLDFLNKHREFITSRELPQNELTSQVVKYKWLANYHNWCICELREDWCLEHGMNREDLLIQAHELPAWYSF